MRLKTKCVDGSVLVYQEKWWALAYQMLLGVMCLAIAGLFYYLGESKAPAAFLVVFCGMFALGGFSILLYLPRYAIKIWKDNGANLVVATVGGIALTPNLGGQSSHYPWTKVSEVILVNCLTLVDSDESTSLERQLIVMLNPDAHWHGRWINGFGSNVSKSGEGKAFLSGAYPKAGREELARALQKLVPSTVPIRLLPEVTFDRRRRKDSYEKLQ